MPRALLVGPVLILPGRSPRPRPSRKISDQLRTGVSHRKHFDCSMGCTWSEIVDYCTQPRSARLANLAAWRAI